MEEPALLKTLTLLRLLAFMVVLYLGLGWLAERYVTRPDSKLKGFFRLLASPVTKLVARRMPGSGERKVLAVSIGLVASLWLVLIVMTEVVRPR